MSAPGGKGETRIEQPTASERVIARRSAEARATVPDLELRVDVDMERALGLLHRQRCSILALLVRACAHALKQVPRANGAYRDGHFELYSRVNVGVVLAADDWYLIPTVFDADQKSLGDVGQEIEQLERQARQHELSSPAFAGGTFTLWDASSAAVVSSTIITNPPQAAALAAGAIREVPVVRDQTVVPGRVMTLTLACDHRILYGPQAARFLNAVKSALESGAL